MEVSSVNLKTMEEHGVQEGAENATLGSTCAQSQSGGVTITNSYYLGSIHQKICTSQLRP